MSCIKQCNNYIAHCVFVQKDMNFTVLSNYRNIQKLNNVGKFTKPWHNFIPIVQVSFYAAESSM